MSNVRFFLFWTLPRFFPLFFFLRAISKLSAWAQSSEQSGPFWSPPAPHLPCSLPVRLYLPCSVSVSVCLCMSVCGSHSAVSSWVLCLWDSSGKNTGVGCCALLHVLWLCQSLFHMRVFTPDVSSAGNARSSPALLKVWSILIFRSSLKCNLVKKTQISYLLFRLLPCVSTCLHTINDNLYLTWPLDYHWKTLSTIFLLYLPRPAQARVAPAQGENGASPLRKIRERQKMGLRGSDQNGWCLPLLCCSIYRIKYVTSDIYKIVFNLQIQSPDPYHCVQITIR